MAIGEDSKTHLTLAPKEILFLEIRIESEVAELIAENPSPLRFCYFAQDTRPTSVADMDSDSYCITESATNSFPIANTYAGKKLYMGIENDNAISVPIMLMTETSTFECVDVGMGQTHTFTMKKSNVPDDIKMEDEEWGISYCVSYHLSHAEDIEIFIDVSNPKLKGITETSIAIGEKFETIMSKNVMVIEGKDLENYCEKSFDDCWVTITIDQDKDMNTEKETFSVSVSYLN